MPMVGWPGRASFRDPRARREVGAEVGRVLGHARADSASCARGKPPAVPAAIRCPSAARHLPFPCAAAKTGRLRGNGTGRAADHALDHQDSGFHRARRGAGPRRAGRRADGACGGPGGGPAERRDGREVTMGGELRPTLFPSLGIRVGDVSIGNPDWVDAGPLIAAERLDVSVEWAPLLRGEIRLDRAEFVGPVSRWCAPPTAASAGISRKPAARIRPRSAASEATATPRPGLPHRLRPRRDQRRRGALDRRDGVGGRSRSPVSTPCSRCRRHLARDAGGLGRGGRAPAAVDAVHRRRRAASGGSGAPGSPPRVLDRGAAGFDGRCR
jgi:hypothetical protein